MKIPPHFIAARVLFAAVLFTTPGLLDAAEKAAGYDAFPLVRTRNIFDPNRRPPKKESEQARPVTPSRPRSVHLSLTGTMVTDGKALAFFTGSRSEFNKIATIGEKVGDFTVTAITGAQVDLKQGDKPTVLGVGKRLQLEGTEADGTEPEPSATSSEAPTASSDPSKTTAPGGAPPSAGSPSDVLKRMMERRAQEMKK